MTILHVHDRVGSYGGGEVYVAQLREGLRRRGQRAPVLYLTQDGQGPESGDEVYYAPKPHGLGSGLRMKQWLAPLLHRIRPDLVHCHTLFSPVGMAWLCSRVPMIFTLHSLHLLPRRHGQEPLTLLGLYDRLLRRLLRSVLKRLALWVAPSEAFAMEISGEGYHRVAVIPHFTEKSPTSPIGMGDEKTILYVGRLSGEKGVDALIDTLCLLRDRFWQAVVVGDGPLQDSVRARLESEGLAHRVRLTGWLSGSDLDREYQNAAVVVVPSVIMEAFGLVGIEAMAFGKPVVAFDAGGVREWLRDGQTGYVVPQGNCRMLADRIQELLDHPERARAMGEEGRRTVDEQFRLDAHLTQVMALYKDVIRHGSADARVVKAYACRN